MNFTIAKPPITPRQKGLALAIAGCADLCQIVLFPFFGPGIFSPLEDLLDVAVACMLMAICGFRWQFVLAFIVEIVPGLDLFPTWTALVLSLGTTRTMDVQGFEVLPGTARAKQGAGDHPPIDVNAVVVPPVQRGEEVR